MIRRVLKWLIISLCGLYACLHVVVASSPVQKRLFEEIRQALLKFGLDLQIESVQFSAFVPRFYLNRVTLGTTKDAPVQFPEPLHIDKIKVQFQPLGLLQRKISISEALLFHPRIFIPQADQIYKRIKNMLEKQSQIAVQGTHLNVEFKRIGIVDALFHVDSQDPPFSIRSRSLSAFLTQDTVEQQNIVVNSNHMDLTRNKLEVAFQKVDVDVDLSGKSLRVNKGQLQGEDFNIVLKGATVLPKDGKTLPDSFHGNYEGKISLRYLNQLPELKLPNLTGFIASTGNIKLVNGGYTGTGTFEYGDLELDGYKLGKMNLNYGFNGKKLDLTDLKLQAAGGEITTSLATIRLEDTFPITTQLKLDGLKLRSLLATLKEENAPVQMDINGTLGVKGQFVKPFGLDTQLKADFSNLLVLNDLKKPPVGTNKTIAIKNGQIHGNLKFSEDKLAFVSEVSVLQGKAALEGYVGFDNKAELRVKGTELSLTELHDIADLRFKGKTNLNAEVEIRGKSARVRGDFETMQSEISDLVLGTVRGKAFYENGLLSFEDLSRNAIEPVRGFGFVDFTPKDTHYRFDVSARRAGIDEIFSIFNNTKLDFPAPKSGETNVRIRIEGGHDPEGIEVVANGTARNFSWYGEKWLSSTYNVRYRPKFVALTRAMLVKRSGGLEARGHFEKGRSELSLLSRGLRLEELNWIGKAPVQGEIVGSMRLKGDFNRPTGEGDVRLVNSFFRGNRLEDSTLLLRVVKGETELSGSLMGERLRGRLIHSEKKGFDDELIFFFKGFDVAPLLSLWMEKDLPPINSILLTGDMSLRHVLEGWDAVSGSGTLSDVNIGFRGNPMRNEQLVQFKIQKGALTVDRFRLNGPLGQLAVEYAMKPDQTIIASADGKMDLQHIQPFIPGLEYGVGKVSLGLRMSGTSARYSLLGNIQLEDGVFRIIGLEDEYRNANVLLTLSQDRINVDRFDAQMGGGTVKVSGDVRINKFRSLAPNLAIQANRVQMKANDSLSLNLNGDFTIKGTAAPYQFAGRCKLNQARLTDFTVRGGSLTNSDIPAFNFDVRCEAKDQLLVQTDVMNAEFRGNLRLTGNTNKIGLLGEVEGIRGSILFKETKFNLETGNARFEDPTNISPRFNVTGTALVREQAVDVPQSYDVNLQVFGTPSDYKIRLSSVPQLAEPELISLLILGVTSRSQEGNYVDFGTTVVGSTPFQTKLQDEFGLDIKVSAQKGSQTGGSSTAGATSGDTTVPSVKLQKEVTKKTKVSVSNTIDAVPLKEFKIEHMLNDNFTVNGARTEKNKGASSEPAASYGVDFRYRFNFE